LLLIGYGTKALTALPCGREQGVSGRFTLGFDHVSQPITIERQARL